MVTHLLAEAGTSGASALRGVLALWVALALLGLVLLLGAWVVLRRARRHLLNTRPRDRARTSLESAWQEAGRRAEPETVHMNPSNAPGEGPAGEASGQDDDAGPDEPRTAQPPAAHLSVSGAARGSGDRPVVLITGGVKRVGLAIARAFASRGFHTIVTYNQSSAREVTDALSALRHAGGSAASERLDLDDPQSVEAFAQAILRSSSRLDVLVHNASIYEATPLGEVTPEDALRHFRVNALAPLLLSRRLAPLLGASPLPGGGSIIAMADMHVLGRPRRDLVAYSMSKAALVEIVQVLARELAPRVRVNGVAPGVVAFPESGGESSAEFQAKYISRVPLGRSGTPEDAAEVVRWLAMDATYITGEIVRVDGGRWLS